MTIQDNIWASRIRNLPELNESQELNESNHDLVGKNVLVGEKAGKVTKEVGDDATGEVYEVEL